MGLPVFRCYYCKETEPLLFFQTFLKFQYQINWGVLNHVTLHSKTKQVLKIINKVQGLLVFIY